MFKKEAEDELIPVATLPEKDRPRNPIPGADAAATIESLRKIAPAVAKSGDRQAIDTLNSLYRTLKGVEPGRTGDGYRELANRGEKSREAGLERANDSNIEDADQVRATEFRIDQELSRQARRGSKNRKGR